MSKYLIISLRSRFKNRRKKREEKEKKRKEKGEKRKKKGEKERKRGRISNYLLRRKSACRRGA